MGWARERFQGEDLCMSPQARRSMILLRDLRKLIFRKISLFAGGEWTGRGNFVLEGERGALTREVAEDVD